ncbi:7-carboxy-7-deazaguanine synthase QueE [Acidihalobacter aeolianus]|uniref:7-carboxy-7-deazaguanine synthase n=1 Tax=Acidihalobacter aeolianus TaxID=2792603 RepID=A0A1D8KA56_9GAMM|nr:7-carboxy-7-deazaguanine synthase QueE [Acidihalobacter aeolianus]AOV17850.1 7-carboxy-7-deazaguanine synthase QueE [Acidihalobacter aeolianus]
MQLRITEIFLSLQGEARDVGRPTVFVRLTGCPLRCHYCDTAYAFSGGLAMPVDEVLAKVEAYGVRHVTVTGGEPLAQRAVLPLLASLSDAGLAVSLETSGALDVSAVDPRVVKVMDLKCPDSGEADRNRLENLASIGPQDQIKFVIASRNDYIWSREMMSEHGLAERCEILFSPVHGRLEPQALAEWILEDRLPVRFQIQLHKYLWGEEQGR